MDKRVDLKKTASNIWEFVHDINCGHYDGGNSSDEDLMAISEIIEAAEEIVTNKNYIIKDIIK